MKAIHKPRQFDFSIERTLDGEQVEGNIKARDELDARRKIVNRFDYPMSILYCDTRKVVG